MKKTPLHVIGMQGFGDNIHQRAALRMLMEKHDVYLETCHAWVYHDMVLEGLRLIRKPTMLRMQKRNADQESGKFRYSSPSSIPRVYVSYGRDDVARLGSIMAAMLASCGLDPRTTPDFSLPVPDAWRVRARAVMADWDTGNRPVLIYRPIVLRKEWMCPNRNPDPAAYAELFASLRKQFFVVSVASIVEDVEWIVGPEQDVDLKLHDGIADSELMAALFAEADMVFANPGFVPALAQAVGTPCIVVYGGRECYDVTERAGAHLAPTLGIDPDRPCRCFSHTHQCDKRIALEPAVARVVQFSEDHCLSHFKELQV